MSHHWGRFESATSRDKYTHTYWESLKMLQWKMEFIETYYLVKKRKVSLLGKWVRIRF
jgi:hypothetical protein